MRRLAPILVIALLVCVAPGQQPKQTPLEQAVQKLTDEARDSTVDRDRIWQAVTQDISDRRATAARPRGADWVDEWFKLACALIVAGAAYLGLSKQYNLNKSLEQEKARLKAEFDQRIEQEKDRLKAESDVSLVKYRSIHDYENQKGEALRNILGKLAEFRFLLADVTAYTEKHREALRDFWGYKRENPSGPDLPTKEQKADLTSKELMQIQDKFLRLVFDVTYLAELWIEPLPNRDGGTSHLSDLLQQWMLNANYAAHADIQRIEAHYPHLITHLRQMREIQHKRQDDSVTVAGRLADLPPFPWHSIYLKDTNGVIYQDGSRDLFES